MEKQITLQTKSGEFIATITTVAKGWMFASFEMNGEVITGKVNTRKAILEISENMAARIKETPKALADMYDSCFEVNFEEPFLSTNHDGETMVKKGTKKNLFTGEIQRIEKTLWSK